MRSLIRQSVVLSAPSEVLYASYLDPRRHAAITGAPATVSAKSASPFRAFDGGLTGTTLAAIPSRLIIQSWRSNNFRAEDPDSTLILTFHPAPGGGRIDLLHLDIPEVDYDGVTRGWPKLYWTPWKDYLQQQRKSAEARGAASRRGRAKPARGRKRK